MSDETSSLVSRLQAGDSGAFEELVRDHGPRLLATANRILGDEAQAQDALQDALILAWKNIKQFEGASLLHTWLHRITVNVCLGRLRTAQRKNEVALSSASHDIDLAFEGLPVAWSEPGPTLEKRVAMRRAMQKALQRIPEDLRVVLLLRDVEELSSREVAEQLGITDDAVRQRLHRARVVMAEILRPELCDGPELTCGGDIDLLLDLIDKALPDHLVQPVGDHVAGCSTCQNLMATYKQTIAIPRVIADLTTGSGLTADWIAQTRDRAANAFGHSSL